MIFPKKGKILHEFPEKVLPECCPIYLDELDCPRLEVAPDGRLRMRFLPKGEYFGKVWVELALPIEGFSQSEDFLK